MQTPTHTKKKASVFFAGSDLSSSKKNTKDTSKLRTGPDSAQDISERIIGGDYRYTAPFKTIPVDENVNS